MIVAAHQPNLFPWLGFFGKMRRCDLLILLDTVQFTKRGFQNRVRIVGPSGVQWLTVPVQSKGRYDQLTADTLIDETQEWAPRQQRTIETCYGKSPGYAAVMPTLTALYASRPARLVDLTVPGIRLIADRLGIATPLVLASSLAARGKGSQLLSDLVAEAGGDTYLSGPTGRDYLDEAMFEAKGLAVAYHEHQPMEYRQGLDAFVGGLSALDLLFRDPERAASWAAEGKPA